MILLLVFNLLVKFKCRLTLTHIFVFLQNNIACNGAITEYFLMKSKLLYMCVNSCCTCMCVCVFVIFTFDMDTDSAVHCCMWRRRQCTLHRVYRLPQAASLRKPLIPWPSFSSFLLVRTEFLPLFVCKHTYTRSFVHSYIGTAQVNAHLTITPCHNDSRLPDFVSTSKCNFIPICLNNTSFWYINYHQIYILYQSL